MIEVREVSKCYGSLAVLDQVTFSVAPGTVYGIVGANGSGKTTLLKTISGVFRPDRGSVLINGVSVHGGHHGLHLFIVTDEPYLLSQATPQIMARFYRGYYPDWSEQVFRALLDLFGLNFKAKIGSFSKGMQRQTVLALALASGASCLLLDESFDGLDLAKRNLCRSLFRLYAARRSAAVVLSSHNLRELEGAAHNVAMLEGKHLAFDLSVEDLHDRYRKYRIPCSSLLGGVSGMLVEFLQTAPAVRWYRWEEDGFSFVADAAVGDTSASFATLGIADLEISTPTLEEIFLSEKQASNADLEAIFA